MPGSSDESPIRARAGDAGVQTMTTGSLDGPAASVAQALLLAGLGAVQSLACVSTWAWAVPWLAIAVLVRCLQRAPVGRSFILGWAFGTGWLCASVWWLFVSMHRYGGLPAWLAALAVALLAMALALYLALACAAFVRLRSGRRAPDALRFAALWLLAEWARGVLFTGFPWAASGYSQIDGPLGGLAPWVGVYGIGACMAWAAAWLAAGPGSPASGRPADERPVAEGSTGRRRPIGAWVIWLAPLIGVTVGAALPVPAFTQSSGALRVTLLQPQVAQDEKFAAHRVPTLLAWLDGALRSARGELIVAPETAVPLLPIHRAMVAPGWLESLQSHFAGSGRTVLVGMPLGSFESGYTNSAVALASATAPEYRYDKVHLVPFGEFVPWGFRWFTRMMNIPLGDFTPGPADAPSLPVGAQRVAPNICYEDLFGEELALRFRRSAAAPTVLVNLSNIAWFGETIAVAQHLNISRMRSLELQRPMLRATNTGATAIIDHRGRVQAQLPAFRAGVLEGQVEGRQGRTPYAVWAGNAGLWPLVALALALLLAPRAVARGRAS